MKSSREEILRELEASRAAIARDYHAVRAAANIPERAKKVISRHPAPWIGFAALLGWLLAGRRRKQVVLERKVNPDGSVEKEKVKKFSVLTFVLTLVRIAIPVLKPALTAFAAKKFADLAGKLN